MATPLVEELHLAHPDLPIYAYVSSVADAVNSPLVAHFLRANPVIDKVFMYRGRMGETWRNYDFHDALKDIPADFLIMPLVYEVRPAVTHRVTSLMETFGLPVRMPIPPPMVRPHPMTENAKANLEKIRQTYDPSRHRGLIMSHFGTRSSGYEYPHIKEVLLGVIREGYCVVTFSGTMFSDANLIEIDVTTITPTDTVEIVRALRGDDLGLWFLSVNSVMWPISATFSIPNLGLQVFKDPSIHQYHYPNIFVVSHYHYQTIPPSREFLAMSSQVQERKSQQDVWFYDYAPEYVIDCFIRMTGLVYANLTLTTRNAG